MATYQEYLQGLVDAGNTFLGDAESDDGYTIVYLKDSNGNMITKKVIISITIDDDGNPIENTEEVA